MTQTTARPPARVTTPPTPSTPTDGALVDGTAVTFAWERVPAASGYRVQASGTEDFEHLRFDTPVGESLSLTVYEVFPTNGASFFWRVCAQTDGTDGPFSEPASFRVATDEAVEAQRDEDEARVAGAVRRQVAAQAKSTEAAAEPGATTSLAEVLTALVVTVVTLIVMIAILVMS